MKKALQLLSILSFLTFLPFIFAQPTQAADSCSESYSYSSDLFDGTTQFYVGTHYSPATVTVTGLVPGKEYYMVAIMELGAGSSRNVFGSDSELGKTAARVATDENNDGSGEATFRITENSFFEVGFTTGVGDRFQADEVSVHLVLSTDDEDLQPCGDLDAGPLGCRHTSQLCDLYDYKILKGSLGVSCTGFSVTQEGGSGCFTPNKKATWTLNGLQSSDGSDYEGNVEIQFPGGGVIGNDAEFNYSGGTKTGDFTLTNDDIGKSYKLVVNAQGVDICSFDVSPIKATCTDEERGEEEDFDDVTGSTFDLCNQIPEDSPARQNCTKCVQNQDNQGIWTAVGCVKAERQSILATIVQVAVSVAGGMTLLMILAAGFQLTTSQGDPKRVGDAKEQLTAAILGLIFIIFSVTILQFIGISILHIPGFGG